MRSMMRSGGGAGLLCACCIGAGRSGVRANGDGACAGDGWAGSAGARAAWGLAVWGWAVWGWVAWDIGATGAPAGWSGAEAVSGKWGLNWSTVMAVGLAMARSAKGQGAGGSAGDVPVMGAGLFGGDVGKGPAAEIAAEIATEAAVCAGSARVGAVVSGRGNGSDSTNLCNGLMGVLGAVSLSVGALDELDKLGTGC